MKPTFLRRLKALLIDYLIILGWMGVLASAATISYFALSGFPDYLGTYGPVGTQFIFFLLLTLPVGLYLYFTESGHTHATIGKRLVGLTVVANGGAPSKSQIAIRTIIKLLPWELAHTFVWQLQYVFYTEGFSANPPDWILFGLNAAVALAASYIAMVAFRRDGRGLHDLTAGTQVVAGN